VIEMILVDTSVWVAHFRRKDWRLAELLDEGNVACHPFIIGELACGNLKNRDEILYLLQSLPAAVTAEHEEVMQFVNDYSLMGRGLGYIDMHLLVSALLTQVSLWTHDKKLHAVSAQHGLIY
jgi:hypothetical protein